ncbi:hypothetical protein [Paenibacillus sp. MBLB4367]|uniref:hypothetical protein n=1 Tax=Paenibacillus sp. MBLB4367 TaxID=3384767 RepID=UPI0039083118
MNQFLSYEALVRSFLQTAAELILLQPGNRPAIMAADVDGDREAELTAAYRYQGELYLIMWKSEGSSWYRLFEMKGKGSGVSDLMAAPVARTDLLSVIVGWQTDKGTSELDLLQWSPQGFYRLIPEGTAYSHLELEDMPGLHGRDGICELALWRHDADQAFAVETYRWEPYRLVPSADVYPYYFRKVVPYYEALANESPDHPLYRSYLADAKEKAGIGEPPQMPESSGLTDSPSVQPADPPVQTPRPSARQHKRRPNGRRP